MLAKKYKSQIISIVNPFSGIYTLEFRSLGSKYKYLPGQFLHIALNSEYDGSDQWPDSRCFSMQSNPGEENIKITYTIKGEFTRKMEAILKVGSEVWLKLPYGDLFTQSHSKINSVFIAGGTGITPFLSLFTHESFIEYVNPKIYLGFRSKDYNIYNDELNRMIQIRSNSSVSELVEENSSSFPKYYYQEKEGVININQILFENSIKSNYFISGPPAMIKTFKQILIGKGVAAKNVLTDDWE